MNTFIEKGDIKHCNNIIQLSWLLNLLHFLFGTLHVFKLQYSIKKYWKFSLKIEICKILLSYYQMPVMIRPYPNTIYFTELNNYYLFLIINLINNLVIIPDLLNLV